MIYIPAVASVCLVSPAFASLNVSLDVTHDGSRLSTPRGSRHAHLQAFGFSHARHGRELVCQLRYCLEAGQVLHLKW